MPRGTASKQHTRYAVRLIVPRRSGWRAWGSARTDFEQALADLAGPAIVSASGPYERQGAHYLLARHRPAPSLTCFG